MLPTRDLDILDTITALCDAEAWDDALALARATDLQALWSRAASLVDTGAELARAIRGWRS